MSNIYCTGSNIEAMKAFIQGSSNAYPIVGEEGHLIAVFRDSNAPREIKQLDELTYSTSDNTLFVIDNTRKVEMIAEICHAANAAYCLSQGDNSQVDWNSAPDWQKASAKLGVHMHLLNPSASPAMSHESWMKQKLDEGWVHGDVKDEEKKTHPCIVDYDQLPKEQQAKDFIFKAIVNQQAKVNFPGLNEQLASK